MTRFHAVLLDWRGTLVHDPPLSWWVDRALSLVGRGAEQSAVQNVVDRLNAVFELPEFDEIDHWIDSSADVHRRTLMDVFRRAGLDDELATALYELDFDPVCHPLYPDVPATLAALRDRGVATALVSNIHFDLRPELSQQGILELFGAVVLSFERATSKPEAAIFEAALDEVGCAPSQALMVGDNAATDGGAAAGGVATLILPGLPELGPRGLDAVLGLC